MESVPGSSTPEVRLRPMTAERFPGFREDSMRGFTAQQVESGAAGPTAARQYAETQFDRLLPDGLATLGQHLYTVYDGPDDGPDDDHDDGPDDGPEVGELWLALNPQAEGAEAFVYDISIHPDRRGQGLGRATMLAAEAEARRLGAATMKLNVFGHNIPARRLYDSLGFEVAAVLLRKEL